MRRLVTTAVVLCLCAAATAAEVTILRGARVIRPGAPPLDDGSVVIRGGVIEAVGGADLDVPGAEILDFPGATILPGLVDGCTQLGLVEIRAVPMTNDHDEDAGPMSPQVHTADGLNTGSSLFRITRMNGTTSALVVPSDDNLVPGRSCVIALEGDRVEDLVRLPLAALHVSLGSPAMERFGERKQAPSTRMGELAMLRQAVIRAREYRAKWDRYREKAARESVDGEGPPDPPEQNLELDAWLPVLRKEMPLIVRAQRASDIQAAVRLKKEFDLPVVLLRASEAWKVADELAAEGVPVLYGPVTVQPSSVETLGARPDAPLLLHRAGVDFALVSADTHNARNLPYEAGLAVAHGLPLDVAIDCITRRPARILGLGARVGDLAPGMDADVIVLDGDVIQPRTRVLAMWIRGVRVELTSRQTELVDRHR